MSNIPDRVLLPLRFDVKRMQDDLWRIGQSDWIGHFVTQNYVGDWSVIPLRGPAGATHPVMMIYSDPTCSEFSDAPFLDTLPYFREVLESFRCPLQAVRLMNLSPGSSIEEHTDFDLSAEDGVARLHVPVKTNSKVDFRLNGSRVVLRQGECWYLRLSDPHSVHNGGSEDRVHLVLDVIVNSWLRDLLSS